MILALSVSVTITALCALYALWLIQGYLFRHSFVFNRKIREMLLCVCSEEYARCEQRMGEAVTQEEKVRLIDRMARLALVMAQLKRV